MAASPVTPSDHELRTTFSTTLLIALAAFTAVAPLTTDAYLPTFAQTADDLGISASGVRLTMTTFLVDIALGQLGIGVLSDYVGRRPLLLWGSILALAASIGAALSPSLPILLIARFFQGLGGVIGVVLGQAVIPDRPHGATAARVLNVIITIQGITPVVAPTPGGVLVEPIGRCGILGVMAAFTGLLVVMVLLWVPESLSTERCHDDDLRMLFDGTRELARDHVLVRLLFTNALSFGLLMAYLSAAPFVLRNVLDMGTMAYTAVFGLCGAMVTVTIAVTASLMRRFSQARQVRIGPTAGLAVNTVFAGICLTWLRESVTGPERMPLPVAVVILSLAHVACLELPVGNTPVLTLDRTGRWAETDSTLLGLLQSIVGGLISPLVGLTGEANDVAFGVVIVAVGTAASILAVLGLYKRGEKQRLATQVTEHRQRRLDQ